MVKKMIFGPKFLGGKDFPASGIEKAGSPAGE
jgi:hypothetical protein